MITRLIVCLGLSFIVNTAQAQTTGTIFRDYNGNGTRQTTASATNILEPVVAGVIVNAYNSSDVCIASYVSGSNGIFSIPLSGTTYNGVQGSNTGFVPASTAIRLEFVIPDAQNDLKKVNANFDFPSSGGVNYGTAVRFVTSGSTGNNFAINYPAHYVANVNNTANSYYSVVQTLADPIAGSGNAGSQTAVLRIDYSATGDANSNNWPAAQTLALASQTGSLYGMAYSKQANKIFVSAYLKRHSGLGPADGTFSHSPGAIYIIDPTRTATSTPPAASFFISLDALGYPTHNSSGSPAYGSGTSYSISNNGLSGDLLEETINYIGQGWAVIGTNSQRGLPNTNTVAHHDPATFDQVGKLSLGDIELSDDGRYLFVTNLYDRKIYQLQLNSVTNPTSAVVAAIWSLPDPPLRSKSGIPNAANTYTGSFDNDEFYTGARGYQRPFALKYYRGKLLIGSVTTGEGPKGVSVIDNYEGNPEYTDLWAYVWELDANSGFSSNPILQFPLNFDRGFNDDNVNETYNPWNRTFMAPTNAGQNIVANAQPIFSDIEVDDQDNSLILGFRDRNGDQLAFQNGMLSGALTGENLRSAWAYGDCLRAWYNPTTQSFEIETNAKEGKSTTKPSTYGAFNYQGLDRGEFYFEDGLENLNGTPGTAFWHVNCAIGSLALLPGKQEVLLSHMDPMDYWSGGVSVFNNISGSNPRDLEVYLGNATGDIGKANGLGDLELFGQPAPIEIGNRVWSDLDADGIQDANEPGFSGVTVQLYSNGADGVPGTGDDQLLGTTTTNASGQYFFTTLTGTDGGGVDYGVNLQPNSNYNIRIGSSDWNNTTGVGTNDLVNRYVTLYKIQGNGMNGASDNDAFLHSSGFPMITFSTSASGNNSHTYDFGFSPAVATVGNQVWFDENGNGDFDESPTLGINGVTVKLFKETTPGSNAYSLAQTTTTRSNLNGDPGYYLFTVLEQANYKIQFAIPGSAVTIQNSNVGVDLNNDANPADGFTVPFALNPAGTGLARTNLTIDAGFILLDIGDYVWLDANANGVQDAGELPLSGVIIDLYDASGNPVQVCKSDYAATDFASETDNDGSIGFDSPWSLSGTGTAIGSGELAVSGQTGLATRFLSRPTSYPIDTVRVSFSLRQSGLTGSENFEIQYYNGTSWVSLIQLNGNDIGSTYSTFQYSSQTIPGLLSIRGIRFREVNYDNSDFVYVDNLNVSFKRTCIPVRDTTDINGKYSFNIPQHNLQASTSYELRISESQSAVSGYTITSTGGGDVNTDNNGTDAGAYTSSGIFQTPASGSNLSLDFGFLGYSVGNRVWWDGNGNGTQSADESGIANVSLALLQSNGSLVATTTTDENGYYIFSGLPAGSYQVAVTTPLNSGALKGAQIVTTTTTADTDNNNNGNATNPNSNPAAVTFSSISEVFTLGSKAEPTNESDEDPSPNQPDNQSNLTIDFGFNRLMIGDRVWSDENRNGIQDNGEFGIAGIDVELFNASGNLVYVGCARDSVATDFGSASDNDGNLNFSGNWTFSGTSTGITSSALRVYGATGVATRNINRPAGYTIERVLVSFNALQVGVSITEEMLLEFNNGSTWVTLEVLRGETGIVGSISTTVRNFIFSSDLYPDLKNITAIRFRENPTAGYANGDYVVIDDLKIKFMQSCVPARVTTDANGYYNFNSGDHNLQASTTYQIRIPRVQNNLDGWSITQTGQGTAATDNNGTLSGAYLTTGNITSPASGTNLTYDFGFYSVAIGDYVWLDGDADGVQDVDEPVLENVLVTLHNTSGTQITYECGRDSATTNMDFPNGNRGSFNFSGKWISTTNPLTLLSGGVLNLSDGADASRMLYPPSQYNITRVDVRFTALRNSAFDNGDNIRVQYYNGSSWVNLDDIPGSELNTSTPVTYSYSSTSISGLLNIRGIRFTELNGIHGTEFVYVDNLAIVFRGTCNAESTTDADGLYQFSLANGLSPGGNYQIRISENQSAIADLAVTSTGQGTTATDNNGTDAGSYITSGNITAPNSGRNLDYDFGFKGYSIGNLVWWDENNDGDVDAGEDPIEGVELVLIDAQGDVIASTTTDVNGKYHFHGLLPGTYQVAVLSGFNSGVLNGAQLSSVKNQTADLDNNNDGDTVDLVGLTSVSYNVISAPIVLGGQAEPTNESDEDPITNQNDNMSNLTVDFGFFRLRIGDKVWLDLDADGVQDPGEPGIPGVVLGLYYPNGSPVVIGGIDSCEQTVATDFSDNSVSDNDGSMDFTGSWTLSPTTGSDITQVTNNELKISGLSGTAQRSITQPNINFDQVVVTFKAKHTAGFSGTDNLVVNYYNGSTWVQLASLTITDMPNNNQYYTFTYSSSSVSGLMGIEGIEFAEGSWTSTSCDVHVDDVEVSFENLVQENVATDFSGNSATDNDGTINFTSGWSLTANTSINNNELDLGGLNDIAERSFTPPTTFTSVTVQFSALQTGFGTGDYVRIRYYNGTSWVLLDELTTTDLPTQTQFYPFSYSSTSISGLMNIQGIQFAEEGGFSNSGDDVRFDNVNIIFHQNCVSGSIDQPDTVRAVTDINGNYSFTGRRGLESNTSYQIRIAESQTAISGLSPTATGQGTATTDNNGTDAGSYITSGTITSPGSGDDLSFDFGFLGYSVGNLVWWDNDNDGVRDNGEPGIPGINLSLLDVNGSVLATTTTDQNGKYYFGGLLAGSYQIAVTSSMGAGILKGSSIPSTTTTADIDNNNNGSSTNPEGPDATAIFFSQISELFVLGAQSEPTNETDEDPVANQPDNQSNLTIDFAFVPPTTALGNMVFADMNQNGIFDAGDSTVRNVTILLFQDLDGDGDPETQIASTTTNDQGFYQFLGVGAGTFQLVVASSNFNSNGPLDGASASSHANSGDTLTDSNSEGIESGVFVLQPNFQPADDQNDGSLLDGGGNPIDDVNSNFTFDFGFSGGALPVSWLSFEVTLDENKKDALLFWQTGTEINNSHFEITRSTDAENFEYIETVKSKALNGNSQSILSYSYVDLNIEKLPSSIFYYRIKQVDFNGESDYSPIRSVVLEAGPGSVTPNPTRNSVRVHFGLRHTVQSVELYSYDGSLLESKLIGKGEEQTEFDLSTYADGVYFIRVIDGSKPITTRIVKH